MKRITFEIDFLGVSMEVAQVRSEVTIGQLVQEILVEFALEHQFLNQHQPQNYVLRTAVDSIDLPPDQAIHQIGKRSKLFFREKEVVVPETAVSASSGAGSSTAFSADETAMVAAGVGKGSSLRQATKTAVAMNIKKIDGIFFTRLCVSFFL